MPIDAKSVPIIESSVDLNRQALAIMAYLNRLAVSVLQIEETSTSSEIGVNLRVHISRCEQSLLGSGGINGCATENIDIRNCLDIKFAGLSDQRISLIGNILSLESQFLRQ